MINLLPIKELFENYNIDINKESKILIRNKFTQNKKLMKFIYNILNNEITFSDAILLIKNNITILDNCELCKKNNKKIFKDGHISKYCNGDNSCKELNILYCPICNKKILSLKNHLLYKHNIILKEFKKENKYYAYHLDIRKRKEIKCEYCRMIFNLKNIYQKHLYDKHNIKKEKIIHNRKLKCKICGKKINLLFQHIFETHNINWKDYCKKYNYVGPKAYFSEKHKKSLSKNKKIFYNETNKGKELKKEQSIKWIKNNPSKDPNVAKKISDAAIKKIINNEIKGFSNASYGITIKFNYNNKNFTVRSFEEFKVIYLLLKNNIKFKYEKIIINYKLNNRFRKYLLDLKINEKYFEIKGNSEKKILKIEQEEKFKKIISYCNFNNIYFKIVNYNIFCKEINIKKENDEFFYKELRCLLDNNKAECIYTLNENQKSRILKKIDVNYKNNPNIKITYRKGNK